jgi:hypothetical protein
MKILISLIVTSLIIFLLYKLVKFLIKVIKEIIENFKKPLPKELFTPFDYPGYPGGYVFYWKKICIEKNNQMEIKKIEKFIKDNKLVFEYDKMNVAEMEHEKIVARRSKTYAQNYSNESEGSEGSMSTASTTPPSNNKVGNKYQVVFSGSNAKLKILYCEITNKKNDKEIRLNNNSKMEIMLPPKSSINVYFIGSSNILVHEQAFDISVKRDIGSSNIIKII